MIECYTGVTFADSYILHSCRTVLLCTIYSFILHICRVNGKPEMSHKKGKSVTNYTVLITICVPLLYMVLDYH